MLPDNNLMRQGSATRDRPTEHLCSECGWRGLPKLRKVEELDPQEIYDALLYARRVKLDPCFIGHKTWFLSKDTPLEAKEMAAAEFKTGLPTCPKCPSLTFTFGIKLLSERAFVFTEYFTEFASPTAITQLRNLTGQDTPASALLNALGTTDYDFDKIVETHLPEKLDPETMSHLLDSFCRIAAHGSYEPKIEERQDGIIAYMINKRGVIWHSASADALHRMEKAMREDVLGKLIIKEMFNREFGIENF